MNNYLSLDSHSPNQIHLGICQIGITNRMYSIEKKFAVHIGFVDEQHHEFVEAKDEQIKDDQYELPETETLVFNVTSTVRQTEQVKKENELGQHFGRDLELHIF